MHDPLNPCRVCGGVNFLAGFVLDQRSRPSHTWRGVKYTGNLCQTWNCADCGTWNRASTVRAGSVAIGQPVRQWMVDILRAMKKESI